MTNDADDKNHLDTVDIRQVERTAVQIEKQGRKRAENVDQNMQDVEPAANEERQPQRQVTGVDPIETERNRRKRRRRQIPPRQLQT